VLYLKGTASFGLHLGGTAVGCPLPSCCDSYYAQCWATIKSVTDLVFQWGIGAISWKAALKQTVSRTTAEAENIAAGDAAKEVQWVHELVSKLALRARSVPVSIDNVAARELVYDPLSVSRINHIRVAYLHVRELVQLGQMDFTFVPSAANTADILTKPLGLDLVCKHRSA
jgi:hypothetical protein